MKFIYTLSAVVLLCLFERIPAASLSKGCRGLCTREITPVCGIDNFGNLVTFSNACTFEFEQCTNRDAGWRVAKEVACDEEVRELKTQSKACRGLCTREYAPVCGENNFGTRKTFSNECMFDYEECNNRAAGWKISQNSECNPEPASIKSKIDSKACRGLCTREYDPVCGENNFGTRKTFNNECLFEYEECNNRAAGWKIFKKSECNAKASAQVKTDSKACRGLCTREYDPVCGVNNFGARKTFSNECVFGHEQCNNRAVGWKILKRTECNLEASSIIKTNAKTCKGLCTREYAPVCGENNYGKRQTFNNMCMFDYEQCNNRAAGWRLHKEDEC